VAWHCRVGAAHRIRDIFEAGSIGQHRGGAVGGRFPSPTNRGRAAHARSGRREDSSGAAVAHCRDGRRRDETMESAELGGPQPSRAMARSILSRDPAARAEARSSTCGGTRSAAPAVETSLNSGIVLTGGGRASGSRVGRDSRTDSSHADFRRGVPAGVGGLADKVKNTAFGHRRRAGDVRATGIHGEASARPSGPARSKQWRG